MTDSSKYLAIYADVVEWAEEDRLRKYLKLVYRQIREIHNSILHALFKRDHNRVLELRAKLALYEQVYVTVVRRMQELGFIQEGVIWNE